MPPGAGARLGRASFPGKGGEVRQGKGKKKKGLTVGTPVEKGAQFPFNIPIQRALSYLKSLTGGFFAPTPLLMG